MMPVIGAAPEISDGINFETDGIQPKGSSASDMLEPMHFRGSTASPGTLFGEPGVGYLYPTASLLEKFLDFAHDVFSKKLPSFLDATVHGPKTALDFHRQFCDELSRLGCKPDNVKGHLVAPWSEDFLTEIKRKAYGSWDLNTYSPNDINFGLLDVLPSEIKRTLLPINVEVGRNNFYESFGMGYLACREGGEPFRRAVAHRIITEPSEFQNLCSILREEPSDVIANIRNYGTPTNVEIAVLSKIVEKNIAVFEFDGQGNIVSDSNYNFSPLESEKAKTVFIGCLTTDNGNQYFPLIRKTGISRDPLEARTDILSTMSNSKYMGHAENNSNNLETPSGTYPSHAVVAGNYTNPNAVGATVQNHGKYNYERTLGNADGASADMGLNTKGSQAWVVAQIFGSKRFQIGDEGGAVECHKYEDSQNNILFEVLSRPESIVTIALNSHSVLTGATGEPRLIAESEKPPVASNPAKNSATSDSAENISVIRVPKDTNSGLVNYHNMCYINATMQAVLSLPFIQVETLPLALQGYYTAIFGTHDLQLEQIMQQQVAYTNLNRMLEHRFRLGEQNDVHELLQFILAHPTSAGLLNNFQISIQQTLKCSNAICPEIRSSITEATEITIMPNIPIQEAINEMFGSMDRVHCNCGSCNASEMNKSVSVATAPHSVMLLTNWFHIPGTKIKSASSYKQVAHNIFVPTNNGEAKYLIRSFITHIGNNNKSGHYKSYIQTGNNWICCDDSNVTISEIPCLAIDETVYLQFYTKCEH